MKKIFVIQSSLLISLIFGLAVLEFILHMSGYKPYPSQWSFVTEAGQTKSFFFDPDPYRIYALRPNTFLNQYDATDQRGFRFAYHAPLSVSKPVYTMTLVGDSFTYGSGMNHDQAYPILLEQFLNQQGKNVRVHNAGVPGYGPDQEFLYIKKIIFEGPLDMIVWNFNMNDIDDSNESCLLRKIHNQYIWFPAWMNTLFLQGLAARYMPQWLFPHPAVNVILYAPNRILGLSRMTPVCTQRGRSLEKRKIQIEKIQYLIGEAKKLAKEKNIRLVITIVPFQWYFDRTQNNRHWSIAMYIQFRDALKQISDIFLDTNERIALLHDSILASFRSLDTTSVALKESSNVLGANTDDLSSLLFRMEEKEFPFGWRHLNIMGNQFLAESVGEFLLSINPEFQMSGKK